MNPAEHARPDPTVRFSDRVEDYVRYRPGYPSGVLGLLAGRLGAHPGSIAADIGSGTGIFSELLLAAGYRVIGVEPNAEMRSAAERLLGDYSAFTSTDGTAEATGLANESVDLITAAQAFHWFDAERARREFRRILRAGGPVALIWNERLMDTPFLREYETLLLAFGTDYHEVGARHARPERIATLFDGRYQLDSFENLQVFDYPALAGRLLSSSYAPKAGHPRHDPMLAALRGLFDRHQVEGRVHFRYETQVYHGRLE